MLATDRHVSREAATVPDLLIGRNSEPDTIPAAFSHSLRALTGQATSPACDRDRATHGLLVGLAAADRDQQSGLRFRDVGHVQSDQLRTTKRTGKAEQKQCSIPQS